MYREKKSREVKLVILLPFFSQQFFSFAVSCQTLALIGF